MPKKLPQGTQESLTFQVFRKLIRIPKSHWPKGFLPKNVSGQDFLRGREVAHGIRGFVIKPEALSSNLETHMVEGER